MPEQAATLPEETDENKDPTPARVVSAIATAVNDVASTLEAIERIAAVLNTPRSAVLTFENYTKRKLTKIFESITSGGYAATPSPIIDPETTMICGARNTAGSVFRGTKGIVMYEIEVQEEDDRLALYAGWHVPWEGPNTCTAVLLTVLGDSPFPGGPPLFTAYSGDALTAQATCGVGKQDADMRFSLLKNE